MITRIRNPYERAERLKGGVREKPDHSPNHALRVLKEVMASRLWGSKKKFLSSQPLCHEEWKKKLY